MKKTINVGLIGFGNVGRGVYELLHKNGVEIERRTGFRPVIKKIGVKSMNKKRPLAMGKGIFTSNIDEILNNDEIQVVVELIGGYSPAKKIILKALRNGKHVVTANKALLARSGMELFEEANRNGASIYLEGAVGGAIPIVLPMGLSLSANKIQSIYGILNGTCNYILTKMTEEGIDYADALKLVELRGQLMQAAVPAGSGGMAAVIGLDDAKVEALCQAYPGSEVLEPVNYNAPGQVVVAGETAALDWLQANGKSLGARMIMRLPVSVPSHCSLMRGAADQLAARLAQIEIRRPAIPVLHNLDAQAHSEPDAIRNALKQQLYRPVRWTQTIRNLQAQGIDTYFECGPGKVLIGLNKRILDGAQSLALEDPASLDQALALTKTAV